MSFEESNHNCVKPLLDSDILKVEDYVLVKFVQKKSEIFYVGRIVTVNNQNDLDVTFLRKNKIYFVYPSIEDVSQVNRADIFGQLPPPKMVPGTSRQPLRLEFDTIDLTIFNIR